MKFTCRFVPIRSKVIDCLLLKTGDIWYPFTVQYCWFLLRFYFETGVVNLFAATELFSACFCEFVC